MNPIEELRDDLIRRFPGIIAEIDPPVDEAGLWHLDVHPAGGSPLIVVEWQSNLGFGISTANGEGLDGFGLKPDESYPDAREARDRIVRLILAGGQTEPPATVRLEELRRSTGLEVAMRAGFGPGDGVRIDEHDEIRLGTLHRIVAALGGRLSVRVEFPDGTVKELTGLVKS